MKKKVNHSVDEEILKEFNRIAEEKSINKSKWIEKQMYLFIKENNNG